MRQVALAGLLLLPALAACAGAASPAPAAPGPAVTLPPAREQELNRIVLTANAAERLGIETTAVSRLTLPRTRLASGTIMAPPGGRLTISAPWAGTIHAPVPGRALQAGSDLEAHAAVFRLTSLDPDPRAAAVAATTSARARVEAARAAVQRSDRLLAGGGGSVRATEEARARLIEEESQASAMEQWSSNLDGIGFQAGDGLHLQAPFAATLLQIHVAPGQTVAAGAPLFEIMRTDTLWVRVALLAGEIASLRGDAPAGVLALGAPATATAREARPVSGPPTASPASATVDLYYQLAGTPAGELHLGALRPGERVAVRLPLAAAAEMASVPWSAVIHDVHGGTWVYENPAVLTYVRRRVEVADVMEGVALLERGPAAATAVVTAGAAELYGYEFGTGK